MFNARVSTHDAQIPKAIYTTPKESPIAIEAWWHGLCQTRQKLHLSKPLQCTNRIFPKYNEARGRANKAIRSWMLHGSRANVHQEKNANRRGRRRIAHQTCPKLKPYAVSSLMEQECKAQGPFSTGSYFKNSLNARRLCDKWHKQKLCTQKTEMKCDVKHVKKVFDTLLRSWLLQLSVLQQLHHPFCKMIQHSNPLLFPSTEIHRLSHVTASRLDKMQLK